MCSEIPDYGAVELYEIGGRMPDAMQYELSADAQQALREYIGLRRAQPNYANARSIRNALDRARLRQVSRPFEHRGADNT